MDALQIAGAVAAVAGALAAVLFPALRLRQETRETYKKEAEYERSLRLSEQKRADEILEEKEGIEDALRETEELAERLECELREERTQSVELKLANEQLRTLLASHKILTSAAQNPLDEIASVFNASRDLWLLSTPDNNGSILQAYGPWEAAGIDRTQMIGQGWRKLLAPDSRTRADKAEASALAKGGRTGLWYRSTGGRDVHVVWVFGRYNGQTLSVGQVRSQRVAILDE